MNKLKLLNVKSGVSPIARKSSFTFMAVLADVSINSRPVSSAYVWASFTTQHTKMESVIKNNNQKIRVSNLQSGLTPVTVCTQDFPAELTECNTVTG